MWSGGAVPGPELSEQSGEVVDGVGQGAGCEPAFEGLVEAFDLSLGLRVAGAAVLLGDAVCGEEFFEPAAGAFEAGQASGEHEPVVREGRVARPVAGDQLGHHGHDHRAGERFGGADVEEVSGMVVEEVEDLDPGAGGEEPVGDVGLPAFVGQVCFEAGV